MNDLSRVKDEFKNQLLKAIDHLEYSSHKIDNLYPDSFNINHIDDLDNENLEVWESFCARFARAADLFLVKYIKIVVKIDDPGFNGTFRDYLNQAEKLNLISENGLWLKIREIRNIIAHEYSIQDVIALFREIKNLSKILIDLKYSVLK